MNTTDTALLILGVMLTLDVILTWTGLKMLRHVTEITLEIAMMSKTTLEQVAKLSARKA